MKRTLFNKAISFCKRNKYRLTSPRLEVLKIICESKKPIKAYEILKQLGSIFANPKPPTVYRSIEFWKKNNFIHRIESLNAFAACEVSHKYTGGNFMICDGCGKVTEYVFELPDLLKDKIKNQSFKMSKWNLEINGTCKNCL